MKYDNKVKFRVIEEICSGKSYTDVKKEYEISHNSIAEWFHKFIEDDSYLLDKNLVNGDISRIIYLKKIAKEREVEIRRHGNSTNADMSWALQFNNELSEWVNLSNEWLQTIIRGKSTSIRALTNFYKKYLIPCNITTSVSEFLSNKYNALNFYEIIFTSRNTHSAYTEAKRIISFIDWILLEHYSVEDDYGNKVILAEFHNPLTQYMPENYYTNRKSESNKNVLPYRYIKELRNLLCPSDANCFQDLVLAQSLLVDGDWFEVDKNIVDDNDCDCVYRKKHITNYQLYKKGRNPDDEIYEMWSPVRTICLYLKLTLPIRTYQARMLGSGEQDTYMYKQPSKYASGIWQQNDSHLSLGTESRPYEKGVLRRFSDPLTKLNLTGFYINTNKTADVSKDEDNKGYDMPWQYEEVQYWISKLITWQKKYNPVIRPTQWTELEPKHLGTIKDKRILKAMGNITFLFRDPTQKDKSLPLGASALNMLWYNLLQHFEGSINKFTNSNEKHNIKLVRADSDITTYYPLHSLRVSLITAFALEGGVPMPILSKCIAGHARLVMTLYYTKMGISYITDTMKKADTEILKQDQESFERFIKDAKNKQLEIGSAVNDTAAYDAVLNAQKSKAGIIMFDKGICPKGCFGCDTGGTYVNDDTDKVTYGPVQGYPAHNCVRCRWFITGPAFLPGLVNHFNVLSYEMSETSKRITRYQNETEELENSKYETEQHGEIFEQYEELLKYEQLLQQELQKGDDIANNLNATLRLIDKCQKISKNDNNNDSSSTQLVPVGTVQDVGFLLEAEVDEMYQLQAICNGAELFPETDASKALLKRSQIIDMTLMFNKKQPVMFTLSEEEQLLAGNQFMRLLIKRAGSLKEAIPYAIGRKKLEEIGIYNDFEKELKVIKYDAPIRLLSTNKDA
ncbi:MAG: hypothetical protein IKQ00_03355 [Butyrivibrio sp.]|nr:hypothetical protein [Butyrivibrio sp.]